MLFLWSFSLLRYSLCPLDRLICVASLLWFLEHDLPTSSASFTLPSYCAFLEVDPSSSLPSILWVLVSMRQFCVRHLVLPDSWKTTCPLPSCLVFSSVLINPTFHILFTSFLLVISLVHCLRFDFSSVLISSALYLLFASSMLAVSVGCSVSKFSFCVHLRLNCVCSWNVAIPG